MLNNVIIKGAIIIKNTIFKILLIFYSIINFKPYIKTCNG
jgi:hypothetical protein